LNLKHPTCIVRLPQPELEAKLGKLTGMVGVVKLTAEEAVRRALEMDDKLHRFDLLRKPKPSKRDIREFVEWRRSVHGVEMSREEAGEYIRRGKGWG